MWPNGSGWPQWPQSIPSTAEETSRWAELARQWATTNNPQLPPHQFPPPPPPPPPVEDQDDRIFIPPPPPPPSTKFEDSSINRPRDSYEQFSLECCPVLPLDQWQGENLCFHQPPEEDYGRYPNVNEHHPQPPLPRNFRPNAPPPSYGIHKPPPMSCPCPPPSMPFNGEENWMYHNQYQQQSDYSPTPVPPMSFPPPPPSPQGPMTHPPPPHVPLFPIGGGPSVHPCPPPPHYAPHRFPPPRPSNFPVPEHIMPAFSQAAGPWLQQPPHQPRSALPAWLRDELEKLEKQKRKEQEKLEMVAVKGRNGMRDSSNDTIGSTRVRHDSDGAVRMDEESDRGSPIHSENGAESEDGGEDQGGGSNLGKVRAISSFSSAHGGSTSVLKNVPGLESPPPPVTEEEFQAACARMKGDIINEYHRFIKDALTDLLLEVTTSAINEVCEETLLQARLAAYGRENDIDHQEDADDDEGDDEDKSSVHSSQPAVAGVLGLSAYVSDSDSENGDHPEVENPKEKSELPTSIEGKPATQETKESVENKKDTEAEAQATASPKQPSKSSQPTVEESKKEKLARNEKEKKKEKTKSSHDDDKKKPSSSSSLSRGKKSHTLHSRDKDKDPPSKSVKSKMGCKDTQSSSSRREKRRRSRSRKRSRSRDSSVSSRQRRSKRCRSRSRSDRYSRRRSGSRGRRHRSRSSSSSSRSSRRSHHHHHRKRH